MAVREEGQTVARVGVQRDVRRDAQRTAPADAPTAVQTAVLRAAAPASRGEVTVSESPISSSAAAIVQRSLETVAKRPGLPRQFVHVLQVTVVGLRKSQLPRMAAALAYRTIFGLIPVLVIGVIVLAAFSNESEVRSLLHKTLSFAGLDQVSLGAHAADDESAFFQGDPGSAEATAGSSGPLGVEEWITGIIDRGRKLNFGAVGAIGALTLIYAALSMLVEIEKAFNQIYNAPEGRSWARRVTQYWTLMTLGVIFLVLSFTIQEQTLEFVKKGASMGFLSNASQVILTVGQFVATAIISTLALLIIYAVIPNTRVQFVPALMGALFAAILWETGKRGFSEYIRFSAGYSKLYGSIAIVPLFMLWIYVTWMIILLGLQISHSLQLYRVATANGINEGVLQTLGLVKDTRQVRRTRIVDPATILGVLQGVAARFAKGKSADASRIAAEAGIDESVVAEMLDSLAGAGILHRITDADREGGYTLAKPPESIPLADAIAVGESLVAAERGLLSPVLQDLSRQRCLLLNNRTLADILPTRLAAAFPVTLPTATADPVNATPATATATPPAPQAEPA